MNSFLNYFYLSLISECRISDTTALIYYYSSIYSFHSPPHHTNILPHSHASNHSTTLTHTLTHSHSHFHSHTHTLSHSLSLSLSASHTLLHTGIIASFNKRYITLAPVAGCIGLAFSLKDPNGLLKGVGSEGISIALLVS